MGWFTFKQQYILNPCSRTISKEGRANLKGLLVGCGESCALGAMQKFSSRQSTRLLFSLPCGLVSVPRVGGFLKNHVRKVHTVELLKTLQKGNVCMCICMSKHVYVSVGLNQTKNAYSGVAGRYH